MPCTLVLTVIGPDQPGLVETLSATVAEQGGSWESSRMARLAGQFAGILEVVLPAENAGALEAALALLETTGLRVHVEVAGDGSELPTPRLLRLDLVGQDRPGIVREISGVLAAAGVNVVELSTECASAPMSGEMLFTATARLDAPSEQSIDGLRTRLETLADELMVDVTLEAAAD